MNFPPKDFQLHLESFNFPLLGEMACHKLHEEEKKYKEKTTTP